MATQGIDKLYAERSGVPGVITVEDIKDYTRATPANVVQVTDAINIGYVPQHGDFILVSPGNDNAFVLNLPDATVSGQVIKIKFRDAYAYFRSVTIEPFGTQFIDSFSNFTLTNPGESIEIFSGLGRWHIL